MGDDRDRASTNRNATIRGKIMRYAEVKVDDESMAMLVAFDDTRERDAAAAAFEGSYFIDMPWIAARQIYDLRRFGNPRYSKRIEIGGREFEAILTRDDEIRAATEAAAIRPETHRSLKVTLEAMLERLDDIEEG